jgi:hypothetical protein
MEKSLIKITTWNEFEIRIELFGNGHYVRKEDISAFIEEHASDIALEVKSNLSNMGG